MGLIRRAQMKKIPTWQPVVAVALLRPDGCVLVQRRGPGGAHAGLWEFPGGKIAPGEAPDRAAVREITEELGVVIAPDALRAFSFAADPAPVSRSGLPLVILLYTAASWVGEPRPLVATEIAWLPPTALAGLAMPPLDVPLARALADLTMTPRDGAGGDVAGRLASCHRAARTLMPAFPRP